MHWRAAPTAASPPARGQAITKPAKPLLGTSQPRDLASRPRDLAPGPGEACPAPCTPHACARVRALKFKFEPPLQAESDFGGSGEEERSLGEFPTTFLFSSSDTLRRHSLFFF